MLRFAPPKVRSAEDHLVEVGLVEVGPAEGRFIEVRFVEVGPVEVRSAEVRPAALRPTEDRPIKVGLVKVGPAEVCPAEVHASEVRPTEDRPVEVRSAEVDPAEVRPGEVHPTEIRPMEDRPAEIGLYFVVLIAPLIPSINAAFEDFEVLCVGHVGFSGLYDNTIVERGLGANMLVQLVGVRRNVLAKTWETRKPSAVEIPANGWPTVHNAEVGSVTVRSIAANAFGLQNR